MVNLGEKISDEDSFDMIDIADIDRSGHIDVTGSWLNMVKTDRRKKLFNIVYNLYCKYFFVNLHNNVFIILEFIRLMKTPPRPVEESKET